MKILKYCGNLVTNLFAINKVESNSFYYYFFWIYANEFNVQQSNNLESFLSFIEYLNYEYVAVYVGKNKFISKIWRKKRGKTIVLKKGNKIIMQILEKIFISF